MKAIFGLPFSILAGLFLFNLQIFNFGTIQKMYPVEIKDNYPEKWKKVDSLVNLGQPKSALEIVEEIYTLAKNDKNDDQIIRSFVYRLRLKNSNEEDAFEKLLYELRDEAKIAPFPNNAIMHSMLAEMYWMYHQANYWKFSQRSFTTNFEPDDIKTWSLEHLVNAVNTEYQLSLQNKLELQKHPIETYNQSVSWGNKPKNLRPTLYDFLIHRAIDFYINSQISLSRPADYFQLKDPAFFADAEDFVKLDISSTDTLSLHYNGIKLIKELLTYRLSVDGRAALLDIDLKRLNFVYQHSVYFEKDNTYLEAMKKLEQKYNDIPLSTMVSADIAQFYANQSAKYVATDSLTHKYKNYKAIAHNICTKTLEKYPATEGSEKLLALKYTLETVSLNFVAERFIIPNEKFAALVTYQNLSDIYIRVAQIDYNTLENLQDKYYGTELYNYLLSKSKTVYELEKKVVNDKDFLPHSSEIILNPIKSGTYVIFVSNNKALDWDKNISSYLIVNSTQLSFVRQSQNDGSVLFSLLNRKTGQPIAGVNAEVYLQKYNYTLRKYVKSKEKTYVTDANGQLSLKSFKDTYDSWFVDFKKDTEFLSTNESYYLYTGSNNMQSNYTTHLFTDRAIYRPGQTIYFKGILINSTGDKRDIVTNSKQTVYLYDVNSQKIAEQQVTTNEYGTFSGSFTIPTGLLNGQMQIVLSSGNKFIQVEEYKRPTFEVTLKPFDGNYQLNDLVTVKGLAQNYSGAKLTDAKIKFRIQRQPRWFGWWYYYFNSPYIEIENGELVTNENGEFELKFKAIPDLAYAKNNFVAFNYLISVDVTDLNGETQSTTGNITVGYIALQLNTSIAETVNKNSKGSDDFAYQIYTQNLNGEFIPAQGELTIHKITDEPMLRRNRLWNAPDKPLYSKQEWDKEFEGNIYDNENALEHAKILNKVVDKKFNTATGKTINLSELTSLQSGNYVIELKAIDAFNNPINYKKYFTLFSDAESKTATKTYNWFTPLNTYCEPGQKARFLIGTAASDVKVIYQIEHKNIIVHTEYLNLSNEQKVIEIPVEEKHRGNFSVHFTFVKNNRYFTNSETVTVPYTNKMLDIEFITFRDKLYPGQDEQWKLKLKGKNGDKVMAEMLATLYDESLDAFKANYFGFDIYNSYYTSLNWTSTSFSTISGNTFTQDFNKYHYYNPLYYNYFNWYGFGYYSYSYYLNEGEEMDEVSNIAYKARSENPVMAPKNGRTLLADSKVKSEVTSEEQVLYDSEVHADSEVVGGIVPPGEKPKEVQVRTNFNETAFFYPHLQTNENGEIIIEFKIPESLTKWKMLGFAHTKDLKYGTTVNHLVTQKDLMVMPNAPRFFRENDAMEFPVKISNISSTDISGTISLEFTDAITLKPITNIFAQTELSSKPFKVEAGKNSLVTFKIVIPEGLGAVMYKVVAKSDKFSDGEQKAVPVLTNRMLVTESMPLPIRSKETKNFEFTKLLNSDKSKTLRHQSLTLEFTSNPAWYAIQALPYLMEYPYECNEQTFSRYYANSIASHIANSSPKIKAVFDSWMNTPKSEALLSNLEKNQELKALMLEETPWVLNSQNESERKKRIGLLFDLNKMANELTTAIKKLDKEQSSNGGWPWFTGMPESRYITQHIVTGMGHLDKLGVKNVRNDERVWNMVKKAIAYLDDRIVEDYKWLKKHYTAEELKMNHLSQIAIHYLYGRSYFTDIEIPKNTQEAFNYYKGQAETYWLQNGKYEQGMIALALHRYKTDKVPALIIKSLKEFSTSNDEMGMYWKDNISGYYWYQAPIETQALMIEAFDEITKDEKAVDDMKVWLLKQKQTQDWKTTKATVEACYALLLRGTNWLISDDLCTIKLGDITVDPKKLDDVKVEAGTGYFKKTWQASEVNPKMGKITVTKPDEGVSWGAVYWQYFEQLDKITSAETPLKLKKQLFKEVITNKGKVIEAISDKSKLKIGDKVIVRIELRVDRAMEYVHMKDMRASGFEPINVISRYKYQDGLGYYESTKDAATNFFIGWLPKGTHVFEYPLRVTHNGNFSNGITTIQCMYAPEFSSHSEGIRVIVE